MSKGDARGGHKRPALPAFPAKKAGKASKANKASETAEDGKAGKASKASKASEASETAEDCNTVVQETTEVAEMLLDLDPNRVDLDRNRVDRNQVDYQFTDVLIEKVIREILENGNDDRTITPEKVQLLTQRWGLEGTIWNNTHNLLDMFGKVQWMLARVTACSEVIGVSSFILRMQAWFAYNPQVAPSFIPDVRKTFLASNISPHAIAKVHDVGYLSTTYMRVEPEYMSALRHFHYTGGHGYVEQQRGATPISNQVNQVDQQVSLGDKANTSAQRSIIRDVIRQLLKLTDNTLIHQKLASNIEATLYRTAHSFNDHVDVVTLKQRLLLVIKQYMTRVNEIADKYTAHCRGDRGDDVSNLSSNVPIDDNRRVLLNGLQNILVSTSSWLTKLINNSTINHNALDQVEVYLYYTIHVFEGHVEINALKERQLRIIQKYRTGASGLVNKWNTFLSES